MSPGSTQVANPSRSAPHTVNVPRLAASGSDTWGWSTLIRVGSPSTCRSTVPVACPCPATTCTSPGRSPVTTASVEAGATGEAGTTRAGDATRAVDATGAAGTTRAVDAGSARQVGVAGTGA